MNDKLELRMYGFVPYNISEIQKGIQFGHTVVEYGLENSQTKEYLDWAKYNKTFIILNGGTSNHSIDRYREDAVREGWREDVDYIGSMETIKKTLEENFVKIATFYEPDLNDMLSGICFIVDERVFNRNKYLEFGDWVLENHGSLLLDKVLQPHKLDKMRLDGYFDRTKDQNEIRIYNDWLVHVGGRKNVFLRDFLSKAKLA